MKEVLDTFQTENDIELNIVYGERREGDITSAYADASLAYKLLDWKAETWIKRNGYLCMELGETI